MNNGKLRFGILSTAGIARKNWKGIYDSGNATVVAVASRKLERSRQFIEECQAQVPMETLPQAFGSYEELLACKDVDAVYIPLPTGLRKEWVLRTAAAGKHIVSEKPCAVSEADLREMLEACRKHRVQYMDGVMFMHTRRLARLREVLDDGQSVGEIRRIASAFSFRAGPDFTRANIRAQAELEPLGCLGDLGWYCIRFTLWAMGWQMPKQAIARTLTAHAKAGAAPVPMEFSGELVFEGGVSASFYCGFTAANQQWAKVSGTGGYVQLDDFVNPFAGQDLAFEICGMQNQRTPMGSLPMPQVKRETAPQTWEGKPTTQEASQFRNFTNQVRAGKMNESWFEMALKTQIVTSQCFEAAQGAGR